MRTALMLAALALAQGACRAKPAGACARDIDCPATSDCREARCVPRVRWRPASEVVRPSAPAPATQTEAPSSAPEPSRVHLTVVRPFVRDAGAAPTSALPPAAPDAPATPLKMWQERRRNF